MEINNGEPHNPLGQEFISELSGCTYYYKSDEYENKIKGLFEGNEVAAFCLKESREGTDVYIAIPDGYHCVHYNKGKITSDILSVDAHLTYHGKSKRKKMSGEIHVVSGNNNPLKGKSPYTEAPIASSSNIEIHPLPLCRIELSENPGELSRKGNIENFFCFNTPGCFFNTLEIHLAKKGYLAGIASASQKIPEAWASVFVQVSMHTFFLGKMERKPGWYPQALSLQTKNFELIVMATREYKNTIYEKNTVKYFHTKNYFKELGSRSVIIGENCWFIDVFNSGKKNNRKVKLSDFL